MKKYLFFLSIFVLALLNNPAQARAELINIQFRDSSGTTYSGAGVIGSSGDTWNQLTSGNGTNNSLVNSSNVNSTPTISWTADSVWTTISGQNNGFQGQTGDDLMNSYLFSSPGVSNTITFNNLTPLTTYDLYVYSEGDKYSNGRTLSITLNGVTQTTASTDYTASTFIGGQNYLKIGATTDVAGVLAIDYQGSSGEPNINGMQLLSPVPEPSTFVLMGIGGLIVLFLLKKSTVVS